MQFSTTVLISLGALVGLATAQNPFSFTTLSTVTAGSPFNITWSPSTGTTDTITLVLRQGNSTTLAMVETIASKIQNTGSYLWTPSNSLVQGTGYAFEIIDDGNTAIVNYSGQFSIASTNTGSPQGSTPTATGNGSKTTAKSGPSSETGAASESQTSAPAVPNDAVRGLKAGGLMLAGLGAVMIVL